MRSIFASKVRLCNSFLLYSFDENKYSCFIPVGCGAYPTWMVCILTPVLDSQRKVFHGSDCSNLVGRSCVSLHDFPWNMCILTRLSTEDVYHRNVFHGTYISLIYLTCVSLHDCCHIVPCASM